MTATGVRNWASAQTVSGAAGGLLLLHALFAISTFERTGPPCHFCAIEPGLGLSLLEIGFGVPLAVISVAVFSTERYDPTFELTRSARYTLLAGSILALGGMLFVAATMGYGIMLGGPVMLIGYLLITLGFGLALFE